MEKAADGLSCREMYLAFEDLRRCFWGKVMLESFESRARRSPAIWHGTSSRLMCQIMAWNAVSQVDERLTMMLVQDV